MNNNLKLLLLLLLSIIIQNNVIAQIKSDNLKINSKDTLSPNEFHFIYIDINKSKRKADLTTIIESNHKKIKNQKFIYYLSYYDEPHIAKNEKDFSQLLYDLSEIKPSIPYVEKDLLRITDILNQDEFINIRNEKLINNYKEIYFHFYFNVNNYINMEMYKSFVEKIILINKLKSFDNTHVIIYFDNTDCLGLLKDKMKEIELKLSDKIYKIEKY